MTILRRLAGFASVSLAVRRMPTFVAAFTVASLVALFACDVARGQLVDNASNDTAARLSASFRQAMQRIEPSTVTVLVGYSDDGAAVANPGAIVRADGRPKVGAGVAITAQGHIVTSYRLLQYASSARVRTADGRIYDARDLRFDAASDLAIVKIEPAAALTYAFLGDSQRLQRGDWVLAVGGGTGDVASFSAGVIGTGSARAPDLGGVYAIQHDAETDWARAGGPLVNLAGEVVGFNLAQSLTPTGSAASFAYPVNESKTVLRSLLQGGSVSRAYLGLRVTELSPNDAQRLGAVGVQGALVIEAVANGPAAALGVDPDDILLSIDGRSVVSPRELQSLLEQRRPGEKVMLTIFRAGTRLGGETTLIDAATRQ